MRDLLAKQRTGRTKSEERRSKPNQSKIDGDVIADVPVEDEPVKVPEQETTNEQTCDVIGGLVRDSADEESDSDEGILPILPSNLPPEKAFAMIGKFYKWYDIEELKERYHNKKCEGNFLQNLLFTLKNFRGCVSSAHWMLEIRPPCFLWRPESAVVIQPRCCKVMSLNF